MEVLDPGAAESYIAVWFTSSLGWLWEGNNLFVRCEQRSKVAADYDSIRLEKNPACMDVWCMYVCVIGHWMDFLSRFKPQRAETRWRPPGRIPI